MTEVCPQHEQLAEHVAAFRGSMEWLQRIGTWLLRIAILILIALLGQVAGFFIYLNQISTVPQINMQHIKTLDREYQEQSKRLDKIDERLREHLEGRK